MPLSADQRLPASHPFPCQIICLVLVFFLLWCCPLPPSLAEDLPFSIDANALAVVYSGQESMRFAISWSGGIKIGDLYLTVLPEQTGDGLVITARATDQGLFRLLYPIDNTFATLLRGPFQLPSRYAVDQVEGSRKTYRLTTYDQRQGKIIYQKNNNPAESYAVAGPVYNEFASFFITRVLNLQEQQAVPAIVDQKKHLIPLDLQGRETRDSLFGPVQTIKVRPKMDVKGLENKDGDTVYWLTNDICRVPVEIQAKILIGSLVARLVEYNNPACRLYHETKDTVSQAR